VPEIEGTIALQYFLLPPKLSASKENMRQVHARLFQIQPLSQFPMQATPVHKSSKFLWGDFLMRGTQSLARLSFRPGRIAGL